MLSLFLGITAFVLYFLYDINSFRWNTRFLRCAFLLGTLLIAVATGLDLICAWKARAFSGIGDLLLSIGAGLWFVLLIYCLFFALPFQQTYTEQATGNRVYSGGVYALCRHPGIPCVFFLYLMLGLAALPENLLRNGMIFSFLNLLYAWFQDRVTFQKTFCDYREYQKTVPFLIPTPASIRMAKQTLFRTDAQEDIL